MAPKTNRELTKSRTIIRAFQSMSEGSTFVFNDRSQPLVVTTHNANSKMLAKVADRENATEHQFVWEGHARPRHKPRPNQTNKVHSLTVHSYGISQTGEVTQDELNAIQEAHYGARWDDPKEGLAHWGSMREALAENLGIPQKQATDLVRRAQAHGQLRVVDSAAGIRADDNFPNSKPYVVLEF